MKPSGADTPRSRPDLPCDDPDAGLHAYADVVSAAIGDAGDVVLVGHSLAGLTVPLVAAARPVRRVVLLAALLPLPGRSLRDQLRDEPGILVPPLGEGLRGDDRRRSVWVDAEVAARTMYSALPAPAAAAAFARLRPQAAAPERQAHPLDGWP